MAHRKKENIGRKLRRRSYGKTSVRIVGDAERFKVGTSKIQAIHVTATLTYLSCTCTYYGEVRAPEYLPHSKPRCDWK
jgi:hypothetical protein